MRALCPIALCTAVALAPAAATATPEEAEALLRKAEAAIQENDTAKAVLFLEQAYVADPDPRYIANLGVVYQRSGQYAAAAKAFERYLETDPDPLKRKAAETTLAQLRPEGLIVSRPAGAEVIIDGADEPAGVTPLRTRLLAGPHTVRFNLDDHISQDAALTIEVGQSFQLERDLEPVPVEAGAGRRTAAYVSIGGGAAALLVAGGLGYLTADALTERDAARTESAFFDAQNRANLFGWGSIVAGAVGVGGLAVGAYLLVSDPEPAAAGARLVVGPTGVGINGCF